MYATGLPLDVTIVEVTDFFKKCGRIAKDVEGNLKIKLYADENGNLKGDCRVGYENVESVEIALEMLNLAEIRPNILVSVEQATFQ